MLRIYIYNIDDGAECKFAENRESGGLLSLPDDCAALQRDNMEKLDDRNLKKFNKWNCQVLWLGKE